MAIQKEAAHAFSANTNRLMAANLNSLASNFQAEESDLYVSAYLPVVVGASTAGAGTYTVQNGRYYRISKRVFFKVRLSVAAGHTGTGLIQVSLPLPAAAVGGDNIVTLGATTVNGLSVSGGCTARLNSAATANGVQGAARIYYGATGSYAQATIPATAFEVEFSGEYTTT
ncbi:hypothetical protein BKK80_12470 [Cupriavidus malaysiensis]|uniref:Uncharacterized protein n=1 Tax=Cupriavidus malaysiensis TaxID=367825 RepID=A0ABM6F551_9BURK|nr:hypothetical protein BKK80_12470 [Cupriavidus malaysiensis]